MNLGLFQVPEPVNEPIKNYAPGDSEREALIQKYNELKKALRQYESLRIANRLQKQKLNRFVRAKEMGVNVTDAEIEEERKHLQELNDLLKQQKITVRNLKKDLYD